jgi:HKD family nuclease
MDKISFTSGIRFIDGNNFNRVVSYINPKNAVNFPWTIKESVLAKDAYTTKVLDCTVSGLTNGQQVLLMHICPTLAKNRVFSKIERFILNNIDVRDKNLQGFLLGGKYNNVNSPYSIKLFEKFENFFEKYKIPYSKFKGGPFENNVAYLSSIDEWLISNEIINENIKNLNPMSALKKIFNEVKISPTDNLIW